MAWEYIVADIEFSQRSLDHLGAKGWRFVGYVGSKYVFERRAPIHPRWWAVGIPSFMAVILLLGVFVIYGGK